jgi:hypothetical protein
MTIFRPHIGNSPFRGAFNPHAAIPPAPAAAQSSNATADIDPGPNPQQAEPSPAIRPPAPAEPGAATDRHADLVCLADIEPRPIDKIRDQTEMTPKGSSPSAHAARY